METKKLRSKISGEIVEIVPKSEPLSKGYALGLGIMEGVSVKRNDGEYAFIPKYNLKLFDEIVE